MKFNLNIFLTFFCIIGIIGIILIYESPQRMTETYTNLTERDIVNSCLELSLEDTSKCLVNKIKPYYIYNKTDDRIDLTFSQLINRGGDCKDWSEFYVRVGKELKFNSEKVEMDRHVIALLSDDSGYCILDQNINPYCLMFKK